MKDLFFELQTEYAVIVDAVNIPIVMVLEYNSCKIICIFLQLYFYVIL
jgi:hypothetical protein